MEARDSWIGWTNEERERNLQLVVNNSRFLSYPGCRYAIWRALFSLFVCATTALGTPLRLSPAAFGDAVDAQFCGTSYRAANWTYLGETRGRGRMDQHHDAHGRSVKRIYVYPFCREVLRGLRQDSAPRWIELCEEDGYSLYPSLRESQRG